MHLKAFHAGVARALTRTAPRHGSASLLGSRGYFNILTLA
ncbi:hypothetical protein ATPR_2338 [Acetobacter tropicalis NBRC 101654]|uniref:Uncharacterized protein n=1 Tax=Acetobacter tropicalis NBRC 101654 TaxID=749388 RepID=F7VG39_9PROT|nr:hypothetical protein ATPR_2338 [Acetobacter tropicalis NBRC 101654]